MEIVRGMLVKVIAGTKIRIGTTARVIRVYDFEVPGMHYIKKRCVLEGYGSIDCANVRELYDDEKIEISYNK